MSSESIRMSREDPPSTIGFYRKLYSYFRVTSAVLESCTLLVIIYSLAIILTALVKYWYQSKNLSISLKGQYCLGLYMLLVLTNKLTTIISLFATTQPLKFDSKGEEPQVTLLAAVILFAILTMIRISLVYVYKRFFSAGQNGWERCRKGNLREDSIKRVPRGWKMGDMVDKWINVLINTVVVTPFMVQKQPLEILKSIEKEFNFSPEMRTEKRNSLRKRNSIVKINQDLRDRGNEIERVETVGSSGLVLPLESTLAQHNYGTDMILDPSDQVAEVSAVEVTEKLNSLALTSEVSFL